MVKQLTLLLHILRILDSSLSSKADYPHWSFSKSHKSLSKHMMTSTGKSALTTSFSFVIQAILWNDDLYLCNVKQPNDELYLIIHTFRGVGVASLLLPNCAVEELLEHPHGAAVHLSAGSPGLTTLSYTHIEPPHSCTVCSGAPSWCRLSWTDNTQLHSHRASTSMY
jgi:hypothetical protein